MLDGIQLVFNQGIESPVIEQSALRPKRWQSCAIPSNLEVKGIEAYFQQSYLGFWGMQGISFIMRSGGSVLVGERWFTDSTERTIPKGCRIIGVKGHIFNHEIRDLSFILWSPPEDTLTD